MTKIKGKLICELERMYEKLQSDDLLTPKVVLEWLENLLHSLKPGGLES